MWLMLGDKAGDNAQVDILVEALGWRCELRRLAMLEPWDVRKPRYRPSLDHIDLAGSDALEPPWPDLILTVGRRPSMAALWVREQSRGRTRIVLLGKPSGLLERFDLVILSGEVQIPPRPNVLKIQLPLMRVKPGLLEAAAADWGPKLADLPRPLVGVLVGGPTNPFVYGGSVVERLVAVQREIAARGGTPYLTTSRRTPAKVADALEARLVDGARLFRWGPGSADNPYHGLLALADGFVVTADSLSMQVEVARLRRPLQIFPLPLGLRGSVDQARRRLARRLFAPPDASAAGRLRASLGSALHRVGIFGHTRDFTAVRDYLLERGLATRVGEPMEPPREPLPDDLPAAVARIRSLLGR